MTVTLNNNNQTSWDSIKYLISASLVKSLFGNESFYPQGVTLDLTLRPKTVCESDIFCAFIQNYLPSLEVITLTGRNNPAEKTFSLRSKVGDMPNIVFSESVKMVNCTMVQNINYTDTLNSSISSIEDFSI